MGGEVTEPVTEVAAIDAPGDNELTDEAPDREIVIDRQLSTPSWQVASYAEVPASQFADCEYVWGFPGLKRVGKNGWSFLNEGMGYFMPLHT